MSDLWGRIHFVDLPLQDVRVLAIEQFGAGPWATLQLADMGADVIKIEDPLTRGDVGRFVPPFQDGEDSLFFETFNRGKHSISLDLRKPAGREVFEDLVRHSDVVFSNLRGDGAERLGITYRDLSPINPAIVCASLSGFGATGPRANDAGYDYTIQALAGWMSLTGEPDGPPTKSGVSLVDFSGGYVAAVAILGGLHRARRDGVGCDADVSLFDTALSLLVYVGTWAASRGYEAPRRGESSHPSLVPFQLFATADGHIAVAAAKEKFWIAYCHAIGRDDLASDPRFVDFGARDRNRDELLPEIRAVMAQRTTSEWEASFSKAGVPHGAVQSVAEALNDAQAVARRIVTQTQHPNLGTVRTMASPLRLTQGRRAPSRAPFRGEHTEQVLMELCGYDHGRITALAKDGAFGEPTTSLHAPYATVSSQQ
jgi:crotonobetainyl-CoA:carnitine CoA-transferase CaiB-like acyl-CoA transferase